MMVPTTTSRASLLLPAQVNCVAEVPVFHFEKAISSRLSTPAILHLSILALAARLLAYAALPALPGVPWAVLPVELLQGVTFALCWSAATTHCREVAPEGLQATMQVRGRVVMGGREMGQG